MLKTETYKTAVLLWLLTLFVLIVGSPKITRDQYLIYVIAYPLVAAFIAVSVLFQTWYVGTFRLRVGECTFYASLAIELLFLALAILAAEKGWQRLQLFFLVFFLSAVHFFIVSALNYKSKDNK